MSEDLKPCPFCGGDAMLVTPAKGNPYICCEEKFCTGPKASEAEAIAAWNTRATGWQPIETAPRDGAWLLACRFFDGGSFVTRVVHWSDDFDEWMVSHDGFFTAPTHWMPLPEAPQ